MQLDQAMVLAAEWVEGKVTIVFHNDSDGICAAAIALHALRQKGIEPEKWCIEKMYPVLVEKIHDTKGLVIYLDVGSGEVELITRMNKSKTIILDHHRTRMSRDPDVFNIAPEVYGIKSDECCSSTLSYLFFSKIADVESLIQLAVVGSVEIPGNVRGLNRKIMERSGVEIKNNNGRESYKTKYGKIARSVAGDLTVLGAVGYYERGFVDGVNLCLFGYTKETKKKIKELEEKRKEINRQLLDRLKIEESQYLQWFNVGDAYKGMGTKVIGTLCSYLSHRGVDFRKVLLGFMDVETTIPRFDSEERIRGDYVKVSARAPAEIAQRINNGKVPSLGLLMKEACANVNGFGDGHNLAASGIIPKGREQELITEMESLIKKGYGVTLAGYI